MTGLIPVDNEEKHVINTAPHRTPVGETHYVTLLTSVVVTTGPKRSDSEENKNSEFIIKKKRLLFPQLQLDLIFFYPLIAIGTNYKT